MTSKIQRLISEIKGKHQALNDKFTAQQATCDEMKAQISNLELEKKDLQDKLDNQAETMKEMSEKSNEHHEQLTHSSRSDLRWSESEIDELVKEIEFCIGQLKK